MFEKVLVTLDGSLLSESVLPWAATLARTLSLREVMFLSVIEAGTSEGLHIAEGYLHSKADELQLMDKVGDTAVGVIKR